jgi:hypothetical protein
MREKADANALFSGRLCPQYLLLGYRRILVLCVPAAVFHLQPQFLCIDRSPAEQNNTNIKKQTTFMAAETSPARLRHCTSLHLVLHHSSLLVC